MSYLVGLHTYTGSAGEAMDPQALVHVETLAEAEVIVEAIKTHPANTRGESFGGQITEIPKVKKLEDAMSETLECYVFEDFEWEGCEDLTDEEFVEEIDRINAEHGVDLIVKFRTGE